MTIKILVDFDAFWASLAQDIRAAERQAFVQTFSFEGDRVGKMLADLLGSARIHDRRILVDSFAKVVLSDHFLFSPANWFNRNLRQEARETKRLYDTFRQVGVQIKYGNPFSLSPRKWLRRDHKKLIVIDDRIAYIGGMNFSEHNAAWHDMMLRIEDPEVAAFFRDDFLASWAGKMLAASKPLAGVELHALDGRSNGVVFDKILRLIDQAQASIFVESPYITFPFYDHLRDARRRGLTVTIVTPQTNNWSHFSDYARWEAARCAIDLRLYQKGMSHLKAMLIDDRYLIVGSSNFDLLSYRLYQEIVVIITDSQAIADFREQIITVDLRNSECAGDQQRESAAWSRFRLKLLNKGLALLLD
jgi:cardiolipin synthase